MSRRRFYRRQPPKKNIQLSMVDDDTVRVKMHKMSNKDVSDLKKLCHVDDKRNSAKPTAPLTHRARLNALRGRRRHRRAEFGRAITLRSRVALA